LIWVADAAVAVRFVGVVGEVVSAGVVAIATFEKALKFPAASVART
jgi:hypothetical protein